MNIARLEKRDRAKNMARSYRVGDPRPLRFTAVVREWGRIFARFEFAHGVFRRGR
jgi:predicted DNA-binding WGR domain protein